MARNSEKAMTALARWRRAKEDEDGEAKKPSKRPYLATECDNLAEAEKWRGQVRFVIKRIVVKSFSIIIARNRVFSFTNNEYIRY